MSSLESQAILIECPKCHGYGYAIHLDDEGGQDAYVKRPCLFCFRKGKVSMVRVEVAQKLEKEHEGNIIVLQSTIKVVDNERKRLEGRIEEIRKDYSDICGKLKDDEGVLAQARQLCKEFPAPVYITVKGQRYDFNVYPKDDIDKLLEKLLGVLDNNLFSEKVQSKTGENK